MPPRPSFMDSETSRLLGLTRFQQQTEADLFRMAFELNSEASLAHLQSLVDEPAPQPRMASPAIEAPSAPMPEAPRFQSAEPDVPALEPMRFSSAEDDPTVSVEERYGMPRPMELTPSSGAQPMPQITAGAPAMPAATTQPAGPMDAGAERPAQLGPIEEGNPERFFATAGPYARQVEQETGVPASLSLAIAANETGYGQRRYMAGSNNYHGIQARAGEAGAAPYKDWRPGPNGEQVYYNAAQRSFESPLEGFRGFANFLTQNPRYAPALERYRQTGDVNQLAADIHRAGYAEDPAYTTKITSIIKGIPVQTGVGEVTAPAGVRPPAASGRPVAMPQQASQATTGALDVGGITTAYRGVPYVFGGAGGRTDPRLGAATDCSGFVASVWQNQYGLPLAAHTDTSYNQLRGMGAPEVSQKDARPGDVVYYMGAGTGGAITHHMGIYAGNGRVLDMSTSGGSGVRERDIGHAGRYVILRDPRINPSTPPKAEVPPPIVPTGIAEQTGGQKIPQAQIESASQTAAGPTAAGSPSPAGSGSPPAAAAPGDMESMYRMPLGNPQPMPEDASDSERFVQTLSEPNEPRPAPLQREVPYDPNTHRTGPTPTDAAETMSYRQPLGPTMGPDTGQGEYVDPDAGPRESGYTLPGMQPPRVGAPDIPGAASSGSPASTYNDPTTTGTQTQPIVAAPSTYGAAGDTPPSTEFLPMPAWAAPEPEPVAPHVPRPEYQRQSPAATPTYTPRPEYQPQPAPVAPSPVVAEPAYVPRPEYQPQTLPAAVPVSGGPYESVIKPATDALDAANEWVINSPLGNVNLQGLGRELGGWGQISQEVGEDTQRLRTLLDRYRAGDTSVLPEIQALTASINQRTGAGTGRNIRERVLEAGERNPDKTAETAGALAQGALATAIAPSLGAGVVRNVAAAALDPIGQGIGTALEVPGRAIEAAGAALPAVQRGTRALTEGIEGFAGRNAERVAAADARMAAEGSTAAPGTFGASPEVFDVREAAYPGPNGEYRLRPEFDARSDTGPQAGQSAQEPGGIPRRGSGDRGPFTSGEGTATGAPDDRGGVLASLGAQPIPGSTLGTRVAADVGSSLGSGTMGAAVGAGLPAESDEERRANALTGAAIGMVGGPLASRAMRRSPGAAATFGFGSRPASESAAASNNPVMQGMARQMAGQYTPSNVTNKRGLLERWAQAWTDDRAGLRNFQEAVSRSIGRPLSAGESVAELTRVNPASVASQRLDEGIKRALQDVGDDEDYLAQYLVHSHNVDVAREIGQRAYDDAIKAGKSAQQATQAATQAANTRQFSGDLRLVDTMQAIKDIEQRVLSLPDGTQRWQAIQDAGRSIWDFNRATLERKRDAGIISDDLYNELVQRYPRYVRTDIADYFDKGTGGPAPSGKRLGLSDIGIQKISPEGTTKERVNPLLSTIDQTYSSEAAIARNEAGKAFEELLRLDPSWQSTFKEVVPAVGPNRGNPATTVPTSYTLKNGEQYLRVWDGGQARTYVIPPEYAAIVSPQTGRILGDSGAARAWTTAMNVYKSLITSKNPAFSLVVSPVRDLGDYLAREGTMSAGRGGPLGAIQGAANSVGALADYARAVPDAFAGILEGTYKGDLARMMREGAGQISRPGHEQRELRAALADLQRTNGLEVKNAGDLARLVGNVLTLGAEPIGGRLEQVPRLAASRRAARRGASDLGQAMAFRDATVDFQRAGEWSRVINSAVPFFNVAMQSGAQTVRTFKQNPAAFMGAVGATVGTLALGAEAWNNADPQRQSDYEDVPDYLKKTGVVIMLPGVEGRSERGDRLPNYAWIPVGQYGSLVQTAKEAAKNYVADKPESGWADLGAEVAGIFSPIRGDSAGSVLTSVTPPGLSTGLELAANKDLFRGATIATDRRDEQASALSRGSADLFNAATGKETRPSQWEYLYRDLGGYGATLALEGSNLFAEKLGMRRPKDEDRPIQNTPILGGLANRVVRDTGGQRMEDATQESVRVPESIRPILEEAGLRREEITVVPSTIDNVPLTREEQADFQQRTNSYIEREVDRAQRSPAWRVKPNEREKQVREAVSRARERASAEVLRQIPQGERRQRTRSAEERKAS